MLGPMTRRQPMVREAVPQLLLEAVRERTLQGAGPDPDKQLTPTAMASQEFDAATPGLEKIARLAFVSNGVDEWDNDFEPDPNGPPPAPDDPNQNPDGKIDRYGISPNGFNIWLMRHDGSQQIQITDMADDERDPSYDPGGTVLAFVNAQTGTSQIYTVDVLTQTVTQITTDSGNKSNPTWSVDGRWIAYASDINGLGNRDIMIVRSTGVGAPAALASTGQDESQPTFAPTGLKIAYTRDDGGVTHLWQMDGDGGNQEQLSDGGGDPTANDRDPAWRQDAVGSQIAFASDRVTDPVLDPQRDFNIWSMGSTGEVLGAPSTVHTNTDVTDTTDDVMPAFSPVLPNPTSNPDRAPTRIFFTSYRLDAIGPPDAASEPDIWGFIIVDDRPAVLLELPAVSDRNPFPGDDVTLSCRPYDDETGVDTVVAWFKDPDSADDDASGVEHKIFTNGKQPTTKFFENVRSTTDDCDGDFWLELEADRVGSVQMFDDGDPINSGDAVAGDGIYSAIWTTPSVPSDFTIDIEITDIAGNFINFDDVYGMSTVLFAPRANLLFVNDYCEGQGFLGASGLNNDSSFGLPKESYYTLNRSGSTLGSHPNTLSDGPLGEPYDLWRVICRGAPDLSVLQYYMPTSEMQLTIDLQGLRAVPVANRAVFWAAPHTGDNWAAAGTITDAATQALLTTFVERGGRLLMTGQDIAWALTLAGQTANPFLTNVLGAQYVADDNQANTLHWTVNGPAGDPVADDPWGTSGHWIDEDDPKELLADIRNDASMSSLYPDVIQAVGSIVVYNYVTEGSGVAGVRKQDSTSGSRVVYLAFPYEAIHRRYDAADNCRPRNKRSKLTHNIACYLRTGGIQGRVLGAPGLRPITSPEPIITMHQGGAIVYAQRCKPDGTFVVSGVPPGVYSLEATRPGFKIDKPNSIAVHGGLAYPVQDFVITEAQPGAIQGTVTSAATGGPVANATITAVSNTDPLNGPVIPSVQTATDGTYVIPDVPIGDWDVAADGSTSTPPFGSDAALVTVIPGGTVQQDFQLDAADGTLEVTVTDAATSALLKDALVEAKINNVVLGSGTTDDQGIASFDVPPSTYDVVVSRAGYSEETAAAAVLSAQTVSLSVSLIALPPGSIAGQIARASAPDDPLDGVTVQVIFNGVVIAQAVSQAQWTFPGGNAPRYNYTVPNVPSGATLEVRAVKQGFTVSPDRQVVRVDSGVVTYSVNFAVSALHTFPAGLQYISVPYDYSNQLPPIVLGTPAGQATKLAAYDPALGRYAVYPAAPADRLRLGVAYWLNLAQAQDLVAPGQKATSPYFIPLSRGWNGIGSPFTKAVDFFSLKVRDQAGVVRTIQEAFSVGLVRNGLFAYGIGGYRLATSLVPFTGYWFFAEEPVTLVVTDPDLIVGVGQVNDAPALAKPADGWVAPVVVWSAGMADASAAFGVAPNGPDHLSVPKPPPPGLGDHVQAAFEPARAGQMMAVDMRGGGTQEWRLVVQTTQPNAPVTVTWPDLTQLPATARPVLVDPVAGKRLHMRMQREYAYDPGGEATRTLEIVLNDDPLGALVITGASAAATARGAAVSYTLSRDAQVTVEIRNIAGLVVAKPAIAREMQAGANVTTWGGQATSGLLAPGGKYIVTVLAESEDGQQTSALTLVNVRR